jgi:chromosome segregation ATPase
MSAKTKNKRNSPSIIKKGTATSILSACDKPFIADNLTDYRDKYYRMKPEYDKLQVKSEQMDQLNKENKKLIGRNQQQHTEIIQLNSQIKLLKETSVDRGEFQRLEGFLKKKDQQIKDLETQIDSTKINHIENLKNTINQQNEQIQYLKEGYGKFNVVDVSLKEENEGLKEELNIASLEYDKIKKERDDYKGLSEEWREQSNEICNLMGKDTDGWSNIAGDTLEDVKDLLSERDELRSKVEKYRNNISQLYDDF